MQNKLSSSGMGTLYSTVNRYVGNGDEVKEHNDQFYVHNTPSYKQHQLLYVLILHSLDSSSPGTCDYAACHAAPN